MIRNLKAMGLALVAVFAMSALAASAASAATDVFTVAGGGSTLLTGVGHNHVFTAGNTKVECTTSKFTGTVVHNATTATVDPEYTGKIGQTPHNNDGSVAAECNATGGTATVHLNGCHIVWSGSTTGSDNGTDATIWIVCPPGKEVTVTLLGGSFVLHFPSQTSTSGGVTYTNEPLHTGGAAVKVKATVTGVTYSCAPAFACGLAGLPMEGDNANYTGDVTVTGYGDTDGLPTPITEGARTGVSFHTV